MKKFIRVLVPLLLAVLIIASIGWYLFTYDRGFTRDFLLTQARYNDLHGNSRLSSWFYDLAYNFSHHDENVAIELANLYKADDNYTKAEYTLTNAINSEPSAELFTALCKTYVEQDKLLDAVSLLDKITNPDIKAEIEAQVIIAEQNKELELRKAAYKIESDQEKAKADETYKIEQERIRKTYETERAAAEMTRLLKETELKKQQVEIERERLNVEVREKANAEKDARIARAEAERFERQAKADAELYESQKAAEAIEMKGRAEAEAIRRKAEAMQLYGQAAMLEMVVDKLPEVARAIGEPLGQTDKIILFGEGAATGLTRDVTGSMMQSFEAIKAATNLDIPGLLNKVASGGLVGRRVPDAATNEPAEAPAEPQTESEE